jgi:hypothetical protein
MRGVGFQGVKGWGLGFTAIHSLLGLIAGQTMIREGQIDSRVISVGTS